MIDFRFLMNNELIDIKEENDTVCLSVEQQAPSIEFGNLQFEHFDGELETENNVFKSFEITTRFLIKHKDKYDKALKQSELYRFLFQRKSYFIIHELAPGKRYPVQPQTIEKETEAVDGTVYVVVFKAFKAYSESIETTLETQDITSQKWQYSQGLLLQDYEYRFTKNHFSIFNLGDFTINTRKRHYLKIRLRGRSSGSINIFNQTTGERFIFNDSLSKSQKDELVIDGIHCYKNGVIQNIDCNGELITLVPGKNNIVVENVSQTNISFDTRFLYKELCICLLK